ncbi:lipopolysaccharide heptosyltransferase family protein [Vibrio astriarenae]|uniref:Lipopolysaccharide heptosyltransferase family protein n=1 Tax=Vibrio astriarenae TaxID=1481923 RepID=A0A7Z2T526_9VIBR|nr:glycosyltransferase family 9 protein [Vibrio astriarenae]QIA64476.1 lipopolysaccharide heptosyltransferase family protein [Vibrio astriarenae]
MKNIAVFVPHRDQFGNITTQLPMLCALREEYPSAEITLYSKTDNSSLLASCGVADHVVNYSSWSTRALLSHVNSKKFEQVYNVYSGSERIHCVVMLSNAKKKYGFSNSKWVHRFGNYDHHIFTQKGKQYIALNNLELVNQVSQKQYDTTIIEKYGSLTEMKPNNVVVLPGGGAGAFKVWDIENYCEVVSELDKQFNGQGQYAFTFVLGPDEAEKQQVIEKQLAGYDNVYIAQSPNITDLIALASKASLVLSNDCGPCHIFQMLKAPMIMVWGWQEIKNGWRSPYHVLTEWYLAHDASWCVFPAEDKKNINAIVPEQVTDIATTYLAKQSL